MRIYLSHNSALKFWRLCDDELARTLQPFRIQSLTKCAKTTTQVRSILETEEFLHTIGTLHLLVPHPGYRVMRNSVTYHVYSRPLPPRAFCKLTETVAIATPEFCFAQMASMLSIHKLMMYASELCGTYSTRPDIEEGFVTRKRPLTTVASLGQLLSHLERMPGQANAQRSLRFVADGSASPAETKLELCLSASKLLGGAGFPKPVMNYEVKLPAPLARIARKRCYRCDLAWPDLRVGLEYNSERHHSGNEQVTKDDIRKNILQHTGMRIIVAKPYHLYTYQGFREIEIMLAKALNVRITPLSDEQQLRRIKLRNELF